MIKWEEISWPEFGVSEDRPTILKKEYESRIKDTVKVMRTRDIDALVVYGDREHFANVAFLTGFDPRFEEALYLLDRNGKQLLIVGNEGVGYANISPLDIDVELCQTFSLLGQQRGSSKSVLRILSEFIEEGMKIGCVGWKYFTAEEVNNPNINIEIPSFLTDSLRTIVGKKHVVNANDIFMNPVNGLRIRNSAAQIAVFEDASTWTSTSIKEAIFNLRTGIREYEVARFFNNGGIPLSCHAMVSTGDKVRKLGLSSPSDKKIRVGDPIVMALGVTGALTCRAGFVAREWNDIPKLVRSYYKSLAENYFEVISTWYESLAIGRKAGEVFKAVDEKRSDELFEFAYPPGHYVHLDEFVHTPFVGESNVELVSGAYLNSDIIPMPKSPGTFCYVNVEDGVVLADEALRDEIGRRYPQCWNRIQERRQFLRDELRIKIRPEVLPLSNIPAIFPPLFLMPETILKNV